jgi:hypothetical protein
VAPLPDAGGLRVTVRRDAAAVPAARGADPAGAAAAGLVPSSRVRLVVEWGGPAHPAADRFHDVSPYWGGGAFHTPGGTCTTGFAVLHSGKAKILTAAHCGVSGDTVTTGDFTHTDNLTIGTFRGVTVGQDIALIDPVASATAAGQMYNGVHLTATDPYVSNRFMPVGGTEETFVHNLVYTSGALSGFRPTITVMAVNVTVNEGTAASPKFVSPLVQADKESGENSVGNGDSGGPVGWFSDDVSHFMAMGTISAGGDDATTHTTCTGVPATPGPNGRACSWRVYYAPITTSLAHYGATIRTA